MCKKNACLYKKTCLNCCVCRKKVVTLRQKLKIVYLWTLKSEYYDKN